MAIITIPTSGGLEIIPHKNPDMTNDRKIRPWTQEGSIVNFATNLAAAQARGFEFIEADLVEEYISHGVAKIVDDNSGLVNSQAQNAQVMNLQNDLNAATEQVTDLQVKLNAAMSANDEKAATIVQLTDELETANADKVAAEKTAAQLAEDLKAAKKPATKEKASK